MFLEVACFSKESAVIAAKAGADRIEFCAEMNLGGITPPLEDFLELKSLLQIPVFNLNKQVLMVLCLAY